MEDMKNISKIKVSHILLTPNQKHSFLKTVELVPGTRAPLAGSQSGLSCKSVFVDPDLHLWGSDRVLQISCCTILTRVYQVVYFRYGDRVEFSSYTSYTHCCHKRSGERAVKVISELNFSDFVPQ